MLSVMEVPYLQSIGLTSSQPCIEEGTGVSSPDKV
jgi:hypothetical protein